FQSSGAVRAAPFATAMTARARCARRSTPFPRRAARRKASSLSCRQCRLSCSLWAPLWIGNANRDDGAEQSHASHQCDAAIDEACGERRLELCDAITRVVDDACAIQETVHEAARRTTRNTIAHERVTEDPRAAGGERREV